MTTKLIVGTDSISDLSAAGIQNSLIKLDNTSDIQVTNLAQTRTNITGKELITDDYSVDNNDTTFEVADYAAFLNAVNNIAQHESKNPKAAWERYFVTYTWVTHAQHVVHFTGSGVMVDGQ